MTRKMMFLPIALLGFGLAACQQEELDAVIETEEVVDESITEAQGSDEQTDDQEQTGEENELNETDEKYQRLLDQAKREYEAEELDASAGTLSVLLLNDLSDHSEIRDEGESLKQEIEALQAENAREIAGTFTEESMYKEERQSAILNEEYLAATGKSVQEATDDELSNWFAQKEINEQQEEAESWTKEEAENYAFDQLILLEDLNYEQYFFFVNLMEEEWVQIEVRESVEQDGVSWSNLIGLYRFNVSSDELLKLDSVTGEYQTVQ